jgi:CHAP domain
MTRDEAIAWCQSKLGQGMDFDGQYGNQCVDFFNFYYQYITGRNPYTDGYAVPGAKDLWNVPTDLFDKIANDPNNLTQLPSPGDIIIYNGKMPGTGGYGHVAVVSEIPRAYYEQNYGGMYVRRNMRPFNGYEIGWLSFKGFNQGGSMATGGIIARDDVDLIRIISSEVKGWNFQQVHSGAVDDQELNAWSGQFIRKYITDGWKESESYRSKRGEALRFYDQDRPTLIAERDSLKLLSGELQMQVTAKTQAIAELTAERDALVKENKELKLLLASGGQTPPPTPATDQVVISKESVWTTFVSFVNRFFKSGN